MKDMIPLRVISGAHEREETVWEFREVGRGVLRERDWPVAPSAIDREYLDTFLSMPKCGAHSKYLEKIITPAPLYQQTVSFEDAA